MNSDPFAASVPVMSDLSANKPALTERELKIRPNLGTVQTEHLLRDFFHQVLTAGA
jgi:hypothetical protein